MALIYQAQLNPSKLQLLQAWVGGQPWHWTGGADTSALTMVGAYRFDDPAGDVGIETHLLAAGSRILQVPVTYRSAPLAGAESALIGTSQHSVLGERWVYDACADPVYAAALAEAILTGGSEADLDYETPSGPQRRPSPVHVSGSGSLGAAVPAVEAVTAAGEGAATVISATNLTLVVFRLLDEGSAGGRQNAPTLHGTWPGQETPVLLAVATRARRPGGD